MLSWHGFTEEVVNLANDRLKMTLKIKDIKAIPTIDYPPPEKRPMNSKLELIKLESIFTLKMPDWKESLQSMYH